MLGIYYFDYSERVYPKSSRKMIIGYTRSDLIFKIKEKQIPDNWFCWLSECRTPGYLIDGSASKIIDWISIHLPDKIGHPIL